MQVKCLVLMLLNHDNNTYAIGSEAMLPADIAEGLQLQGTVKIVQEPNQRKEASPVEVIPEVVDAAVVESPVSTAKKK